MNTPAAVKFGAEIRRRREALGLTLVVLAERSGLTPNYIGTIEHGARDPSVSTVTALAKGLGVEPGHLLGGFGEMSAAAFEAGQELEELHEDARDAFLMLLRALAARSAKKHGR